MTEQNQEEFQLEISEKASELIEQYAKKTNRKPEDVIEYVLTEFLQNQLHVIEKRAKEVDEPMDKLVSMQFERVLEYLNSQTES
ncbi:MAG: hypothetical protein FH758_08500 [Firmicutes bacterium]|nr:hypothetical protein [Bacillota bacterium]